MFSALNIVFFSIDVSLKLDLKYNLRYKYYKINFKIDRKNNTGLEIYAIV